VKLINSIPVQNTLGEGVIWDHANARCWWTDIQESQLYCYDPESQELKQWKTPERLCCFAPVHGQNRLMAAFESGFAFYQPETNEVEWIHKIEPDNPGTRLNDGRTDRQGRLWAGTMVEDQDTATEKGRLYCLHNDLKLTSSIDDLLITNSLCWNPDGKTVYHTDTPSRLIKQYPYNTETAEIGIEQAELFVKTERDCYPDGSIVDAQGYLWNAQWGASQVVRYAPDGTSDLVVDLPVSQPSCVAFGGKDLDLLFVTTARQELSDDALLDQPLAGDLFVYQTEFQGLIECGFVFSV